MGNPRSAVEPMGSGGARGARTRAPSASHASARGCPRGSYARLREVSQDDGVGHDSKPVRRTVVVYTHRPEGARPPKWALRSDCGAHGQRRWTTYPAAATASRPRGRSTRRASRATAPTTRCGSATTSPPRAARWPSRVTPTASPRRSRSGSARARPAASTATSSTPTCGASASACGSAPRRRAALEVRPRGSTYRQSRRPTNGPLRSTLLPLTVGMSDSCCHPS